MITVHMIFLVIALVLFVLAAVGVPTPSRFNLIAGGLAFWVLAELLGGLKL